MKTVYVFGNKFIEQDNFAHQVAHKLHGISVKECCSPEQLLDIDDESITILDVVEHIEKPILIMDVNQLKAPHLVSLHYFDLGFFLQLMEKMGMQKNIKIIGIPQQGDFKKIIEQVKAWI